MDKKMTDERLREVEHAQNVLRKNIADSERLIESSDELLARNRSASPGTD